MSQAIIEIYNVIPFEFITSQVFLAGSTARKVYYLEEHDPKSDIDLIVHQGRHIDILRTLTGTRDPRLSPITDVTINSCGGFKFKHKEHIFDIWAEPDLIKYLDTVPKNEQRILIRLEPYMCITDKRFK